MRVRSVVAILLLAFGLRLIFVFFPAELKPFSDMQEYHEKACMILDTGSYGPSSRPPLYPVFLASVYRIFGIHSFAVRLIQALMGTAVCLFTYLIALRLWGERAAWMSGLLVACYPSLVVYTGLLMSENLFIFLLMASLWILLCPGRRGAFACVAAGILLGVACLTRSILIGFIPIAALWLWRKRSGREGMVCLLGALLAIAPWTIRNYRYYQRFIPVDLYGGYNFLIGNTPYATGRQELGTLRTLEAEYWKNWYITPEKKGEGAPPANEWIMIIDPDGSALGYREGIKFIAAHPLKFLILGMRKMGNLYDLEIRDLSWAYSKNYFGEVPRLILIPVAAAIIVAFPLLAILALCGILCNGKETYDVRGQSQSRKNNPLLALPSASSLRLRSGSSTGQAPLRRGRGYDSSPSETEQLSHNNGGAWALLIFTLLYFSAACFLTFGESRFHLPLVPVLALFAGALATCAPHPLSSEPVRLKRLLLVLLLGLLLIDWGLSLMENRQRLGIVLAPGGNLTEISY
ncbi:MAG: glycosyltransferase family 39 protein [Candidatus Aureabacteria bacterium]|nr:glycosyltransferase family 39 protein [Candidatus Auribacterota bacterium]